MRVRQQQNQSNPRRLTAWKSAAALDAERAAQTLKPDVTAPDAAPVAAPDGKVSRDNLGENGASIKMRRGDRAG